MVNLLLNNRKILFVGMPIFVLVTAVILLKLHKTPEEEIELRFSELAETVSLQSELSNVERIGLVRSISDFFAKECHVESQRLSLDEDLSGEQIAIAVSRRIKRFVPLKVQFKDVGVKVESSNTASVSCTVYAEGESPRGDWREVGEIHCRLRKPEGRGVWEIKKVRQVPVLER